MFEAEIKKLLKQAGVGGEINFSFPPKPEMGDLAFACFDIAKGQGKNPAEVAKAIAGFIKPEGAIERVAAFGPYVNFFLNAGELAKTVVNEVKKQGAQYGANQSGAGKKVLIEYPSNNTHKELHVGHLRNICLGNALVKIFSANGFKVIPINYLNDFGAHVAKCLWGLQKFHAGETPPRGGEQKWLGQIYAEASQYLEAHPEEKKQVYELQTKLEARDKSVWKLYQTTRAWSIAGFEAAFKELGVIHKRIFYEQDVKDAGQKIVDDLLQKGIAAVGEGGAIIVDLKKYGLDIGLLRKSNGAGLYLTSDLGLAVAKNKKYSGAAESIHITGSEQIFYFKQLFKILELAGYKYKMTHIPYGLVSLASGKMSSRLGNVILYEQVRDEVFAKVMAETKNRHPQWSEKKLAHTARTIAFAAIKFDFLKHEAEKNITFDAESAASFDGFTGPYVLYTVARINSIARKAKEEKIKTKPDWSLLAAAEEKRLSLQMTQYGDVVVKAFENYNPSVIVKYAFDLAKAYNDFYNKHSVLKAENAALAAARLELSAAVKQTLENSLALLTIDLVKEM